MAHLEPSGREGEEERASLLSWKKIGAILLPGLWILVCQSNAMRQRTPEVNIIPLCFIPLGIVGAGFAKNGRLSVWSIPALGALLWSVGKRKWWLLKIGKLGISYLFGWLASVLKPYPDFYLWLTWGFWLMTLIVLILVPCLAYCLAHRRLGLCVSKGGWVLLGAFGVATVIYTRLYELPEQWWLFPWGAYTGMVEFSFLLLAVIVGFSLKRQTWVAGLFIACCEPFCIEMFRDPSELVIENLLESPSVILESTSYALLLFPVFSFLMVMPIGVLWPGPEWRKKRWLLLLSALTFILMEIARWTALRGTPDAYAFYAWLMAGSSAAQLWLPLVIATCLGGAEQAAKI